MLGKLLKYEIKGTARMMFPLYAALLVLTIINKIFLSINSQATGFVMSMGISMTLYICIIVGIMVLTMVVIIQRFYKNLMTDEGYLMFTLPVPVWQHILAKLLIAMMWCIVAGIVFCLSIFILAATGDFFSLVGQFFRDFQTLEFGVPFTQVILCGVEIIGVTLLAMATGILQIYASIAVGQLFGTHKILGSFGAYIVIDIILQIAGTIMMSSFAMSGAMNNLEVFDAMDVFPMFQLLMGVGTLINVALGAAFFFGTKYLLKNKLNLE
ncbi:MAG: hypothetical protein RR961_06315 [Eubacterium sp.]